MLLDGFIEIFLNNLFVVSPSSEHLFTCDEKLSGLREKSMRNPNDKKITGVTETHVEKRGAGLPPTQSCDRFVTATTITPPYSGMSCSYVLQLCLPL